MRRERYDEAVGHLLVVRSLVKNQRGKGASDVRFAVKMALARLPRPRR